MIRHFFPGTEPGKLTWRRFVRLGGRGALAIARLQRGKSDDDAADETKRPSHF